jgi:[acyl-carrier-protein] S-malonyltransferase
MQAAADALGTPTKMVALVLRPGQLARLRALVAAASPPGAYVANVNGPTQVTVSGVAAAVDGVVAAAQHERVAVRAVPLPVSAPFHTPIMAPGAHARARRATRAAG